MNNDELRTTPPKKEHPPNRPEQPIKPEIPKPVIIKGFHPFRKKRTEDEYQQKLATYKRRLAE